MNKYYRVYSDIDLDQVRSNVDALMALAPEGVSAIAVVKADGYGHGDVAIAKAVYNQVMGYAVATLDEAVNLRENGIDKPIIILGYVDPEEYATLVENSIAATVFDYETAKMLDEQAKIIGKTALCHIKIDTGMRRIGLEPNDTSIEIIKRIRTLKHLDSRGIFTHFATSDETDKTQAKLQLQRFNMIIEKLHEQGIDFEYKHCSNSAAIIDMPESMIGMDLVRLGIAMYGMYPSDEVDKSRVELKSALELKSHVTMVKTVPAGEGVSYGRTFVTERETKLATISVGYGDGYPRALSSKGYVLIRGQKGSNCGQSLHGPDDG